MALTSTTITSWKLQEIVAHSSNVSSLVLGKASGRLLATGGEDCRVNIWAVSKPNCIMSLTGHTSPVESIQFNSSEERVVAGSQSGSLRLWDLEAAKILRTLMGHKASICSLDFHPMGEYLASGSVDSSIKLWDVRRKGCVFRYKGHTQAVCCLAFSPDGKWLASASDDSTVKLWDLIAGKMITEFTSHTSAVNVVQFHPNEYLLASGSADRTVKLWDLEKFNMIGSSEGETGVVRCILFNPDGSCLYSGSENTLRVFGWEPDRCFDVVHVGWGKVSDLAISNNQMIAVSYSQNNVSWYVVDLNQVKKSGSVIQGLIEDKPIPAPTSAMGATLRRNYERPTTSSLLATLFGGTNGGFPLHGTGRYRSLLGGVSTGFQVNCTHARNAKAGVMGDDEALAQIRKGHDTMCVMLTSRYKNLDTVRFVWASGDVKTSLDSAVSMNDLSIVVDILNIINLKPSLWKLDLCTSILPQIEELLQSKYESYVQTGCMSLKLILKRFWPLISDTLTAPPSVGVDITREERHQKCKACYKQLKNLSNVVKNRAEQVGRHGSTFKELQLLMAPLDY
uniref:Katanin p80 WD40 repeat-containing subunit B1 n=1 Tax=Cyprinus carpio TaxID=7962 RepID=A0A8C2CND9_CYPCA